MSGGRVVSGSERRFPRSLIEFQDRFATEGACAEYLFERRWPEGFVCPGCRGGRAWLLKTKAFTYECADLRSADLGDRRYDHACQQAAADGVVLGGVFD